MSMTRTQAEHILDAYLLVWSSTNMDAAASALRDVILDAMTDFKTSGYVSTYPSITIPTNTGGWSTGKTIVSCTTGDAE